jgi:hypothetical protein
MKPFHIMLCTCYTIFLIGMIAGAELARSPGLWIAMIILTALGECLVGYLATRKPKKKLPMSALARRR